MSSFLKDAGCRDVTKKGEIIRVDVFEKSISLFLSGVRPSEIFKETGISKSVFYGWLRRVGIETRGLNNWKPTEQQILKVAKKREEIGVTTEAEQIVSSMLKEAGINAVRQFALGRNNIDFCVVDPSIAIEIVCRTCSSLYFNNGWLRNRIVNLGNSGWHCYILIAFDARQIKAWGIKDMLCWIEFIQSQPAI
ncbi:MAG: hypothetical protein MN733_22660, partial [Nitrososphaera sp.]|nr:hypothetical protein [Nitrososphaera sp.]